MSRRKSIEEKMIGSIDPKKLMGAMIVHESSVVVPEEPDIDFINEDENLIIKAKLKDQKITKDNIPQRILYSKEYKHFVKHERAVNPYSVDRGPYYMFEQLTRLTASDGWIRISVFIEMLIKIGVHRKYKSLYSFLSNLSSFIDMHGHQAIQTIQVDDAKGSIRINPDGPAANSKNIR